MAEAFLGISAYYHDSAAALVLDGRIVAAAQEERFSRKKHDASFPAQAARYVLAEAGLDLQDLRAIAFYDKPFLKFERLLESYHAFAPRGLRSFLQSMPVWVKDKLFMRRMLKQELTKLAAAPPEKWPRLLFPEHHLSHAASAFYPSPFSEAAILTVDGVGEWATTTIAAGAGNKVSILRDLSFPHSVGLLYSAFTYYCGFKVNSGEYKLMGLAPYGNSDGERVKRFYRLIFDQLVDLRDDGSLLLNMEYFDFVTGLRMCKDARWESLFGIPRRAAESELTPAYMDMALAIQQAVEEIVLRMAGSAVAVTGMRRLVMAGGVALNCVANGKLLRSGIVDELWIQPAAGDAGGALGAAYAAAHLWADEDRSIPAEAADAMQGSYLGPSFDANDVARLCRRYAASCRHFEDFDALTASVAQELAGGHIVGWFQGRMEWGPRALGNRSILGDARRPEMQKRLNLKIKYREGFRPFAPAVLAEDSGDFFDLAQPSPYMLLVAPVRESRRRPLPEDYPEMEMYARLYHQRSDIPAVTHIDYSARIQTVHAETNPRFHALLTAFREHSGYGLLVNTSFNVRGEPIVCTPEDAYRCFMTTEMDVLVIGNALFYKNEQPAWQADKRQNQTFEAD